MKWLTLRRIFALMLWTCIWMIIHTQLNWFTPTVAAYEPPTGLIPLNAPPVTQNDAYGVNQNTTLNVATPGVLGNDTDLDSPVITATLVSNPSHGVASLNSNGSFSYTPNKDFTGTDSFSYVASDDANNSNVATVVIDVRSITFRADIKDIDKGECVLFSWVVKGDINTVEFEEFDDDRDPILVAETDERQECPVKDTRYQLKVRWLDGSSSTDNKINIEVDETTSSSSSGSSSSGGGGGSSSTSGSTATGATVPQPGTFMMVTPMLITNVLGDTPATPIPVGSEEDVVVTPDGVLSSVKMLPETGAFPPSIATPSPGTKTTLAKRDLSAAQSVGEVWLTILGKIGMLLGAFIVSWKWLRKFHW